MWSLCFFDDSVVTRGNTKNCVLFVIPKLYVIPDLKILTFDFETEAPLHLT